MPWLTLTLLLVLVAMTLATAAPWQPAEFPIGYWYGPPADHNTLETWQAVKDCGFTFGGMTGYGREGNLKLLDLCQQVGLKAMVIDGRLSWEAAVGDEEWQKLIAEVVADYGQHPALYGYFLTDEPNSAIFRQLGTLSQELQRQDPAHLPYINLFPTYASSEQLGNPTYADHLEQFLTLVKPAVLSYDHYALMANGSERADWYENLALVRAAGLRHNTPPWVIILSLPHLGYRDPSAAEMRWQVYTALAYGMKGIMYFTYWTHPDWEQAGQVAIVDSAGKPGRLYPIVKQLNGEISALGKTLLGLTSTGVYHTGETPRGAQRLGGDAEFSVAGTPPLVIGCFKNAAGASYVMVTNADLRQTTDAELTFRPHVTGLSQISAQTGAAEALALKESKLALHLEPGEGRLLRLESGFRYPEAVKPCTEINFGFDKEDDREGWGGFNSLGRPTVEDGTFTLTFTGDDPFMCRLFLRLKQDQYSALKIRMKLPPCNPEGQIFWTTAESPNFADDKYVNFPTIPDGEWHEYRIALGAHPMWNAKKVRGLRLDPTTGGAAVGSRVEIDYIRGE